MIKALLAIVLLAVVSLVAAKGSCDYCLEDYNRESVSYTHLTLPTTPYV